tara:strand:+ start:130 stop:600 length:471 start_codon:yes stop_codon:yes gene_type:complete
MCVGYVMFNLMMGVLGNNGGAVTLANVMSTARACNNLAYCTTVARIRDQHAAAASHIDRLTNVASKTMSKSLFSHLLARRGTLAQVGSVMMVRNGRRKVKFSSNAGVASVHAVSHFAYEVDQSVVANGRRLFDLLNTLLTAFPLPPLVPQTNQRVL